MPLKRTSPASKFVPVMTTESLGKTVGLTLVMPGDGVPEITMQEIGFVQIMPLKSRLSC